jgi:phage shock protein E
MRARILSLLLLLVLLAPAGAWAQNFRNLTSEELKKKIDEFEKLLVVDTRTSEEFDQGHLPTAINIPPQRFGAIAQSLPAEKDHPLVFYCRGYT